MREDSFTQNIVGVTNLIGSGINKTNEDQLQQEGVAGEFIDTLELGMDDTELLKLRDEWEQLEKGYAPKIKARQDKNKVYYVGRQQAGNGDTDRVVSTNLIFEAEETFIPQALSKNPEPVVWSDNTDEGKAASNDIKTMLQYHADVLCLRKKLGVMVRHWSIYFTGVLKHGWDEKNKDIKLDLRKPQNFNLDPNGFVDEYGRFVGRYVGERIESTAEKMVELFPKSKDYITIKANGRMGTTMIYTEWWTNEYCFSTFEDVVLDKSKNPFFNYETTQVETDDYGVETQTATAGINHFGAPQMPYTFLSVFSLQETPHDITNLIEQNIPNQDRINDRDTQISRNLRAGNNSIALSGTSFTSETAHEAAMALENGDPVLVPDGQVDAAIKRLPANDIPSAVFVAQQNDMNNLRSIFGTSGISAQPQDSESTARGMILNQSQDTSRIGGGIGDALEQVADNVFNWWLQLYCVFYDEPHYAAIMGSGRAVEYVMIMNSNLERKFVISVSPNSMQPKDEITEQNLAMQRWGNGSIDPISLMKKLNEPDPMESAKRLVIWSTNPQLYAQMYFPEATPPPMMGAEGAPNAPETGNIPPPVDESLAADEASANLSQVPINTLAAPTQ